MATCSHCSAEFIRKNKESFCSTACRGAHKRKRVAFRCLLCGASFDVNAYRAKLGEVRYCSKACKYAHFQTPHRNRLQKTCPICKSAFETPPSQNATYCSYTCYGIAQERKEERICVVCAEPFVVKKSSDRICCSWECRVERLRGENHPSWRGGSIRHYGGDWARAKRAARERDNNTCSRCGKTAEENGENMSVHHIQPYRSFDDPNEANRIENLESLCRVCHAKIKD